jgi:DNA-directed RNA polymerase specialized sigma24 family protein
MSEELSDEQLAALHGSASAGTALETLGRRYEQRLKRYLLCLTGSESAGAELFGACLSEVFSRPARQPRVAVRLFGKATALARSWLAHAPQAPALDQVLLGTASLDLSLRWDQLSAALLSLEFRERAALCLTLFERLPYADAGAAMGMDELPLRELAGGALLRLRERLGSEFFGG